MSHRRPTSSPRALPQRALRTTTAALALLLAGATLPTAAHGAGGTDVGAVDGVLQVVAVDPAEPTDDHALTTDAYALVDGVLVDVPDAGVEGLTTGTPLRLSVAAAGGHGVRTALADLAAGEPDALTVTAARPASPGGAPLAAAPAAGAHTVTVLPVHWTSRDGATRTSLTTVAQQTADFWAEQSAGAMTTTVAVRDWVEIEASDCRDVTSLTNRALQAHGLTTPRSDREHVVVYFPTDSRCGWAGQATVGSSYIWVNGYPRTDVVAHELGHNLGLGHADRLECRSGGAAVVLSTSCSQHEYDDRPDVMSYSDGSAPGSLNTALASGLGFVRSVAADPSQVVTTELAPLTQAGAVRAVQIPTPTGEVFVDYRPTTGRDAGRYPAWAGVQVHRLAVQGGAPTSQLLDLQPTKGDVVALPVGVPWTVPGTSFRVTVVAAGATATVKVEPELPGPFTDVTTFHRFYPEIAWFADQGIATGYPDGSFGGTRPVARQAMAAFLHRFQRISGDVPPTTARYSDVPVGHPFYREISWLGASGITTGYPDGSFGATNPVSRDAMAAFLFRMTPAAAGYEAPERARFTDVPTGHPFYREISWLAETGITTGMGDGSFGSGRAVSRDAMAAFLYRYAAQLS